MCTGPYIISMIILIYVLLIIIHIFISVQIWKTNSTFLKIINIIILILFGFLLFFVTYVNIIYLILSSTGGSGLILWKQILIAIDIFTILISYIIYFIMTIYFYSKSKSFHKIIWILLGIYVLSSFPMFLLGLFSSIENCKVLNQ
jgi:hypothetical protein